MKKLLFVAIAALCLVGCQRSKYKSIVEDMNISDSEKAEMMKEYDNASSADKDKMYKALKGLKAISEAVD